jgi:ammonia channel protein AmtB
MVSFFKIDQGMIYTFKTEVDGEVAGPKLFLVQLLGVVVIAAWSGSLSFCYFYCSMKFGTMRHEIIDEVLGGDLHYFGPIKFEGKIENYEIKHTINNLINQNKQFLELIGKN